MYRIFITLVIGTVFGAVLLSCGSDPVKPNGGDTNKVVTADKTNSAVVQPVTKDKFDDTDYKNVIAVLKTALNAEKNNPSSLNKLDSGKAFALVAKFIKLKLIVKEYGFSAGDIDTYKAQAKKKFKEILEDPTAAKDTKEKATAESAKVDQI